LYSAIVEEFGAQGVHVCAIMLHGLWTEQNPDTTSFVAFSFDEISITATQEDQGLTNEDRQKVVRWNEKFKESKILVPFSFDGLLLQSDQQSSGNESVSSTAYYMSGAIFVEF